MRSRTTKHPMIPLAKFTLIVPYLRGLTDIIVIICTVVVDGPLGVHAPRCIPVHAGGEGPIGVRLHLHLWQEGVESGTDTLHCAEGKYKTMGYQTNDVTVIPYLLFYIG